MKLLKFAGFCLILFLSACTLINPFPLSKPGSYDFGTHESFIFTDPARNDRRVSLTVWYPAILPKDALPSDYNFDAEPDRQKAPYPLILSSSKVGSIFGPHLASHGFVVIGIDGQDSAMAIGPWLVNYPLDLLFALNQVASAPLPGLEGMMDANRAGAMGYSFDSYTSLALGGARLDPAYNQVVCAGAADLTPPPTTLFIDYNCKPTGGWEALVEAAGPSIAAGEGELWQPITDPRILAVMPMAPEGAWLFGERGLAAVDRPVLFIAAGADELNIYGVEAAFLYDHLSDPYCTMITFRGEDHMMIYREEPVARMKHFAAAFFGRHLLGQDKYARYLTEKFVSGFDNLAWGVAPGP